MLAFSILSFTFINKIGSLSLQLYQAVTDILVLLSKLLKVLLNIPLRLILNIGFAAKLVHLNLHVSYLKLLVMSLFFEVLIHCLEFEAP